MRLTQRLQLIKLTVLAGLFASILLSINLWASDRWFPKTTFIEDYFGVTYPYDYIQLAVLVLLVGFSFTSQKKITPILLILFCCYLCFDDQNRLQPWFFNSILFLLILLFYKSRVDEPNNYTTVFISLQLLIAFIYIFSGVQKLNEQFVIDSSNWLIEHFGSSLSKRQQFLVTKIGYSVPYIEIVLGVLLLVKPLRFIIVPLVITMHVVILVMKGIIEHNYISTIWSYNLMMIILILLLFAYVQPERFFDISFLFKGICFYIVVTLMLIFPIFSLKNQYDSFLAGGYYSSNLNNASLILSKKAYHNLPYYIRRYCKTENEAHVLNIKDWCLDELNSPCIPEYRVFKNVQHFIIQLTQTNSTEVKFVFVERKKLLFF